LLLRLHLPVSFLFQQLHDALPVPNKKGALAHAAWYGGGFNQPKFMGAGRRLTPNNPKP
jgi:hypothetical protein